MTIAQFIVALGLTVDEIQRTAFTAYYNVGNAYVMRKIHLLSIELRFLMLLKLITPLHTKLYVSP